MPGAAGAIPSGLSLMPMIVMSDLLQICAHLHIARREAAGGITRTRRATETSSAKRRAAVGRPRARLAPAATRAAQKTRRQAAVYDALAINEQVLDEVWTSPSVDVLKVVSSIVVNALDAYEDDPAEYADWVAVHRTGNCDCH